MAATSPFTKSVTLPNLPPKPASPRSTPPPPPAIPTFASKRSMTVAALVPVISVPQFLPTVQLLTEELDRAGYQLILGQTGYDRARESALLDAMISRRVDGIVMAG